MSAIVTAGEGNAGEFVRAAAELRQELPFAPYYGTLNLEGRRESVVEDLPYAFVADVGDDGYCTGIELYACRVGGVLASVIVPEVPNYPADKIELLAPVHLRTLFGFADGDRVHLDRLDTLPDPPRHRFDPDALGSFGAVVFDFERTLVRSEADGLGRGKHAEMTAPLVSHLAAIDCPIGICTRGAESAATEMLERFGDGGVVDAVVGGERADGTGNPLTTDRILRCLDELGVEPGAAAFVTTGRDMARAPFSVLDASAVTESD